MMMIITVYNYFQIIDNRLVSWITAAVSGDQGTYVRTWFPTSSVTKFYLFKDKDQFFFNLWSQTVYGYLILFFLLFLLCPLTFVTLSSVNIFEGYFYFWFFSIPLGPMVNNPWLRIYEWDSNFIPTGSNMQIYEFSSFSFSFFFQFFFQFY